MKTAEFQPKLNLGAHIYDRSIVAKGIAIDGTLIVLTTAEADKDLPFGTLEQPGWATFPSPQASQRYAMRLHRFGTEVIAEIISICR